MAWEPNVPSPPVFDKIEPQTPRPFSAATAMAAEGARIGLISCEACGATILLDPRDPVDRPAAHRRWHEEH